MTEITPEQRQVLTKLKIGRKRVATMLKNNGVSLAICAGMAEGHEGRAAAEMAVTLAAEISASSRRMAVEIEKVLREGVCSPEQWRDLHFRHHRDAAKAVELVELTETAARERPLRSAP
jgi:hypothetical protein